MRPIDADALKRYMCNKCEERSICEYYGFGCGTMADIDKLPTIEAEPVKHGKWERHTNFAGNYYTCTVCKNVAREMPECMGEPIYEFCPYCGARMDGKERENDG